MYELTLTGKGFITTTASTDFDNCLLPMHDHIGDEDANGHVIDATTGEVLVQMENGNIVYLAPEVEQMMLERIFEEDPAAGLAIVLGAMAAAIGGVLATPTPDEYEIVN